MKTREILGLWLKEGSAQGAAFCLDGICIDAITIQKAQ
jgi:hypothetical protein